MAVSAEALQAFSAAVNSESRAREVSLSPDSSSSSATQVLRISLDRFSPGRGTLLVTKHNLYSRPCWEYSAPGMGLARTLEDYIVPNRSPVYDSLRKLVESLRGDEMEVDTAAFTHKPQRDSLFWDDWKTGVFGEVYRGEIYTAVLGAVKNRIERLIINGLIHVDLFGGDGEFVDFLQEYLPRNGRDSQFHIVDSNKKSLEKAVQRFSLEQAGVHYGDIISTEDVFTDVPQPPNLVTAIGGLCSGVVTRAQGLDIARKIFEGMESEGIFIATNYTPSVLNASDYSSMGFQVEQMSIPQNYFSGKFPTQFYVLRKPLERSLSAKVA